MTAATEDDLSFPKKAAHPAHCAGCGGSGWMPVEPLKSRAGGDDVLYSQVAPCTHVWWDDDPDQLFNWTSR